MKQVILRVELHSCSVHSSVVSRRLTSSLCCDVRSGGGSQRPLPRAHLLRQTPGEGLPSAGTSATLYGAGRGRTFQKPFPDCPTEEGPHRLVQRLLPAEKGRPEGGGRFPSVMRGHIS